MVATFPNFSKLHIRHKDAVCAITGQFEPYSDFSFVNLLAWGRHGVGVAQLHGNLVVRLPDYITGKTLMYTMIGTNDVEASALAVLTKTSELVLVPEAVADQLAHSALLAATEDRDSNDYIYDVAHLAGLEGGEFKKKRNKANSFANDFQGAVRVGVITTMDDMAAREIRAVFKQWMIGAHKTAAESAAEQAALNSLFANKASLHLRFTIVRVGGTICAFSVHEICPNAYAVCHFEKALTFHPGIYAYVIQQAAKDLYRQNVKKVNWQQDLGLPGLRQAKMSYHPAGFLRKYTIRPA